ncbi:MAG: hypothetical protein RPU64_11495 [Candidatus Sedimenticola sp. (ex Thyasira tokunagai)]
MEIVLAILLLFGGFTLGSVTADKSSDDKQSTMISSHVKDAAGSVPVTQAMHQGDPTGCRSEKVITFRDLTVSYHGQIERPAMEISDCEGKDCSYNPSAFAPSLEVRSPDE